MVQKKQLSVRIHGKQIGILEQLQTGKMIFTYDSDAQHPISYSMPINGKIYQQGHCEAYFGGLLPESDTAKKIIARQYDISANNIFSLLKAIGHDCAGAISFHEMGEPTIIDSNVKRDITIIDDNNLYAHIKELPQKPLFLGFNDLRLSLAGVQDKAAVCLMDNKIALPQTGCPTTHILKPTNNTFENLCENEFICMNLAKSVGLDVASVEIRHIKDIAYLLIERYDRVVNKDFITRIHQEDFCQALGVSSLKKHQNEGGPCLITSFGLLMHTTQPAIDRNALARAMVFNFLIGNCDAHGKNFSLLHQDNGTISFTPLYDLLSTTFYPTLSKKMAMKIGGEYVIDRVNTAHWEKLCGSVHYNFPYLKKLIEEQRHTLLNALEKNKDFYSDATKNPVFAEKFSEKMRVTISTQGLKN
ncbi:MAG: hypothetical protein A3E84_05015 [Gammaproteobacteria bacterium RIFCSPHIGHO2_12_FULL_42_13]|nr:MAG: hypothetical protein A3E84_05015 [Gammaproteobacteria bacterium RIFCSPHIGHO2_12_FULL_42_13]